MNFVCSAPTGGMLFGVSGILLFIIITNRIYSGGRRTTKSYS